MQDEVAAFMSKYLHAKHNAGVSDLEFLKILNDALLNLGERCLIDYTMAYQDNPKAFLTAFLRYDSIKMAAQHAVKFARKSGILKELEGKKDFSEWVEKQPLEERWKPVLEKLLLIIWGIKSEQNPERSVATKVQ